MGNGLRLRITQNDGRKPKNRKENHIMKNRNIQFKPMLGLLILVLLVCFALPSGVQAVVPPPDGGYPGANTAEGEDALLSRTTGSANTAVGWHSLHDNTEGSRNTAIGAGTLLSNITGQKNTANGALALLSNTTGDSNTANGEKALFSNTEGSANTATGTDALKSNTTGDFNTANGLQALQANTTGSRNTANGLGALFSNTTGSRNTANGQNVLFRNTTGNNNTANGQGALVNNTTGTSNIALGISAGFDVTTANNVICIGASGANVSNSCYIGNIFGKGVAGGNMSVFVDSDGKLGTVLSSRRFKEEIKPMERASEALFSLKPVTFRYKKGIDPQGIPQFGLVAEDVETVNPDLVVRDKEGKVNSVRYDQVNAMLLNEFLKEHRKVEELEKGMKVLTAQLKEQAAQIQKVSAQLEVSRPAPQTALNN
jgi:hypothetical protein